MAVIAPFWATTDEYVAFKVGYSKMYYQVYKNMERNNARTAAILKTASKHVQNYEKCGKFASFKATWVLVVTWVKICPYVYYPYHYYYNNNKEILELNCEWVSVGKTILQITYNRPNRLFLLFWLELGSLVSCLGKFGAGNNAHSCSSLIF